MRRPWGFSPEAQRGSQGASRVAPGKSGLHARGEEKRVMALESREGTRASRRVEEGLSRSLSGGVRGAQEGCQGPSRPSGRNRGLPLRRRRGQGPHAAKTMEPRGFFRVAAGFSSYDVDFRLPLVLALGSPNFPSSCEGKLDVVLESLQGQGNLI